MSGGDDRDKDADDTDTGTDMGTGDSDMCTWSAGMTKGQERTGVGRWVAEIAGGSSEIASAC